MSEQICHKKIEICQNQSPTPSLHPPGKLTNEVCMLHCKNDVLSRHCNVIRPLLEMPEARCLVASCRADRHQDDWCSTGFAMLHWSQLQLRTSKAFADASLQFLSLFVESNRILLCEGPSQTVTNGNSNELHMKHNVPFCHLAPQTSLRKQRKVKCHMFEDVAATVCNSSKDGWGAKTQFLCNHMQLTVIQSLAKKPVAAIDNTENPRCTQICRGLMD